MGKMKAAVFYGPNDIRIENVDVPRLQPDWVLLRVRASGVCGSDLHLYRQKTSIKIESELGEGKYVPGHEISGEVYEVGANAQDLGEGDRVGVEPLVGCGKCEWCRVGWYNLCANSRLIGFYYLGGFAEYCAVPQEKCFKLPKNVSFEEAATLDCIAVAEHAVKRARVCNEDAVAILGAGSIGLFATQAALIAGAREVYVVGTHDFQLEIARKFGATSTINARREKPADRIMELTGGRGVDKAIEAVGGEASTVADAVGMLRHRGVLVVTGIFVKPMPIDMFGLLTKELTLTGAWGYEYWTHTKEFAISLELLASGKIDAKTLITHRYTLDELSEAYEAAINKERTRSIKVEIVS